MFPRRNLRPLNGVGSACPHICIVDQFPRTALWRAGDAAPIHVHARLAISVIRLALAVAWLALGVESQQFSTGTFYFYPPRRNLYHLALAAVNSASHINVLNNYQGPRVHLA